MFRVIGAAAVLFGMAGTPVVLAQGNPTSSIAGRVVAGDGAALPGVTVTVTSDNLQGPRSVVTTAQGDYIIPFLAPGTYRVTYELQGFTTATQSTLVTSAGSVTLNVTLQVAGITEAVIVTGEVASAVASGVPAAITFKQSRIEELPLNRGLDATVALTPGALRTGPSSSTTGNQQIAISGAITSENLILVNGVVAQDNVRRSSVPLFIEDALQETTISTAGVSAEFGRFAGGVVNAITKSGGNSFSGSYRLGLANDDWRKVSPFGETKADVTVPTHEYTVGGPVVRDRLWFFHAGRYQNETLGQTLFAPVSTAYDRITLRRRFEGKATYSPWRNQTARLAYLNNYTRSTNSNFQNELDLQSLTDREDPEHSWSFNYNAVLRPNLFVEGQYSVHQSSIIGAGAKSTDPIAGTLVIDSLSGGRFNAATFCGVCRPEERDNQSLSAKATYFLSGSRFGSHTIVTGYDGFSDEIAADQHQSGSGYRILGTSSVFRNGVVYPVWNNVGNSTVIRYNPILNPTQGSQFRAHAIFVNDVWRASDRLTMNLGVRYDRNDGVNSAGIKDVEDSKVSPRLGLTYDLAGDGAWVANASYAKYVSALVNGIANTGSNAGGAARFDFQYLGPAINPDPNAATLTTTPEALRILFDWFNANGGTNRANVGAALPGVNQRLSQDLGSPTADEVAAGITRTFGSKGVLRVDGVYRKFSGFYASRTDTTTGQVTNALGQSFDIAITENTNDIERTYAGLNVSGTWRPLNSLNVGFGYTLSRTRGNYDGETSASGPVTVGPRSYPEYRAESWNYPVGDLSLDQRHKARILATYSVSPFDIGTLTFGAIQALNSGTPYGAVGSITIAPYVPAGLNYRGAPASVSYYFTDRDAIRAERSFQTDLSVIYAYRVPRARNLDTFVKAEVLNLFNGDAIVNPFFLNTAVLTNVSNAAQYSAFNPFTTTPVQGQHWEKGPRFGQAQSRFAYQFPRLFRMSLGIRF